jgi:hypothetical protein
VEEELDEAEEIVGTLQRSIGVTCHSLRNANGRDLVWFHQDIANGD